MACAANPKKGVPVYDTAGIYGLLGWVKVGARSIAAPEWTALFAVANSMRAAASKSALDQPQFNLYPNAAAFHDIVSGSNGSCGAQCASAPGYDFITGIGSPMANHVIPALVAAP